MSLQHPQGDVVGSGDAPGEPPRPAARAGAGRGATRGGEHRAVRHERFLRQRESGDGGSALDGHHHGQAPGSKPPLPCRPVEPGRVGLCSPGGASLPPAGAPWIHPAPGAGRGRRVPPCCPTAPALAPSVGTPGVTGPPCAPTAAPAPGCSRAPAAVASSHPAEPGHAERQTAVPRAWVLAKGSTLGHLPQTPPVPREGCDPRGSQRPPVPGQLLQPQPPPLRSRLSHARTEVSPGCSGSHRQARGSPACASHPHPLHSPCPAPGAQTETPQTAAPPVLICAKPPRGTVSPGTAPGLEAMARRGRQLAGPEALVPHGSALPCPLCSWAGASAGTSTRVCACGAPRMADACAQPRLCASTCVPLRQSVCGRRYRAAKPQRAPPGAELSVWPQPRRSLSQPATGRAPAPPCPFLSACPEGRGPQ